MKKLQVYSVQLDYNPNENIFLDYDFSLQNDFNIIEHQTIAASYIADNFSTEFSFTETAGILGDY